VAELAATTDQALTDDVRTALAAVFGAWSTWRTAPAYPRNGTPRGFRFPPEVIVVAVRWYLRYNLS
jgi:hypothetical protein